MHRKLVAALDATPAAAVPADRYAALGDSFAAGVGACLQPLTTDARCDAALDESGRRLTEELPGRLDTLYRALDAQAPAARVVVTGYPRLLGTGGTCVIGTEAGRTRFNALTDRLDDLIGRQAAKQGFRFADVRDGFAGHGAAAARTSGSTRSRCRCGSRTTRRRPGSPAATCRASRRPRSDRLPTPAWAGIKARRLGQVGTVERTVPCEVRQAGCRPPVHGPGGGRHRPTEGDAG